MKEQREIKKSLFGSRYFYLNDKTRVRHGFALVGIGITYSLQRRRRCGWRRVAWVFSKQFEDKSLVELVNYLKWEEEYKKKKKKKKKPKCLF